MTSEPAVTISALEFVNALRTEIERGERQFTALTGRVEVAGAADLRDIRTDFANGLLLENIHFHDPVGMSNCRFSHNVNFKSCTFDRAVDLTRAVFENGLCFSDCIFGEAGNDRDGAALALDDARIRGDLAFFRTSIYGPVQARRLNLSGNLDFAACAIEAQAKNEPLLDLRNSKVRGNINFATTKRPEAIAPALSERLDNVGAIRQARLSRSRFANRGGLTSVLLAGAKITEDVDLSFAHFIGTVDLSHIKCSGLAASAGFFAAQGGSMRPPPAGQKTVAPGEDFGGATIEGDLTLSGGDIGLVHLQGISISKNLSLIDGGSGQILIEDSLCEGEGDERFLAPAVLGNVVMIRWHCRDFVHLHAAEMTGSQNDWGVRGIMIYSTKIDRALSFWPGRTVEQKLQTFLEKGEAKKSPLIFFGKNAEGHLAGVDTDPGCRQLLNRWQRRLEVHGNIIIYHCAVGDDVVLTGVQVESIGVGDGRIDILNSNIDGEVIFRSPISFLAESRLTAPLSHLLARQFIGGGEPSLTFKPAQAYKLDMRGVEAKKVDLTGLSIRERHGTAPQRDRPVARSTLNTPDAVLSQLRVDGRVATFARLSTLAATRAVDEIKRAFSSTRFDADPQNKNWEHDLLVMCFGSNAKPRLEQRTDQRTLTLEASTRIPGLLDLQHAVIGELVISDASFQEHRPTGNVSDGVLLDYAQISKFYVARSQPVQNAPSEHNGFPVPVSLADLSVKSWFLENENIRDVLPAKEAYVSAEAAVADPYLDLLDNDPVFRMSSYLAVEKSLRDRGLTEEARKIFIAGVYRDVRTESVKDKTPPRRATAQAGTWCRGDGRYRGRLAGNKALGLFLVGTVAFPIAVGAIWQRAWLGNACFEAGLFTMLLVAAFLRGNLFRLQRPLSEYLGFALCAVWSAVAVLLFYAFTEEFRAAGPPRFDPVFVSICIWLLFGCGMLLAWTGVLRRFVDQLYWSLVDYGTSAVRLAGIIFVLMAISFTFVSGNPNNFQSTLLARSVPVERWHKGDTPSWADWTFGERVWATLRYHVPLVGAIVSEEWQPADKPVFVATLNDTDDNVAAPPSWWPDCAPWPRARDWYGAMLWLNWILWPLFLPFLIHTLSRER